MIRLLDTNVCIALWQRNNLAVRERFKQFAPSTIAICSIVKAELLFVAENSAKPAENLSLLRRLFEPISSYPFDDNAAEHYADIRFNLAKKGKLIGANDLIIAAIARANQFTVVTHNTAEFEQVSNLKIEDWQS